VLDFEGGTKKNLPGGVFRETAASLPIDLVVEECLEFLRIIEEVLGIVPMVYTGQEFHWRLSQARPDLAGEFAKYPLWTPDYRGNAHPVLPVDRKNNAFPWNQWSIWQYTSKGTVAGIAGDVDLNHFRGTAQDMIIFISSLRVKQSSSPSSMKAMLAEEARLLVARVKQQSANLSELAAQLREVLDDLAECN